MCDKNSFEDLDLWRSEFCVQTDFGYKEDPPLVIVATKCDRQQLRTVSKEEACNWCISNNIELNVCFLPLVSLVLL